MFRMLIYFAIALFCCSPALANDKETGYERILRTETLRCGYYVAPPYVYRDPDTDSLSGPTVDIIEHMGTDLGLTIEWAEEQSFGTWGAALRHRRIDMMCAPVWIVPRRTREVTFGTPLFFSFVQLYGRPGENRFGELSDINDPSVTIALLEGSSAGKLAAQYFPDAQTIAQPQASNYTLVAMDVITGKADALFWDSIEFSAYNEKNPGKLALIEPTRSLSPVPITFAFARGDHDLAHMINTALRKLQYNGYTAKTLAQWLPEGQYKLPAKPYDE